ncbi:MAG: B12-binding domain-containing radical SAM protein [Treponema sp.]|jgi:radical SAM superfamily enzyme YgiQ (UPF0313 family)|nr:B12-binding domain-containing radical SAM protein [Treponema sp.]
MRILFINVSKYFGNRVYREYPLGAGMLATIVQNAGYKVKLYDMAVEENSVIEIVSEFEPDIIGLSYSSAGAHTAYGLIKSLKSKTSAVLIAGGIHPTLYYEEALNNGIDFVVVGEAENVILPLIDNIEKSRKLINNDFDNFSGIAYWNKDSIKYKKQSETVDLNELPFVNRDLFNMKHYTYHSILSSRGCIHQCMFCSSKGLAGCLPRMSAPERIISEIEFLACKYGKINLYWADDMFFHDHAARIRFCNLLIQKKLPVQYVIQLRADNINDELMIALKQSGCIKVAFGAESGSNEILKTIKKDITAETIENAIICAKKNQLRIKTWWIVGLPGTYDQQLEALKIIKLTYPNEVAIHIFAPLPGSDFWDEADKYGIHLPESLQKLELLGYYTNPDEIHLDYLSTGELRALISIYEQELSNYGYIPTDRSEGDEEYIYTTPNQKKTFRV